MEEEAVSRNINLRSFKGQKRGRTSPVSDEKPQTSIETDEVFLSHHPTETLTCEVSKAKSVAELLQFLKLKPKTPIDTDEIFLTHYPT